MTEPTTAVQEAKPTRKRASRSNLPDGFTTVQATDEEIADYRKRRPNATPDTTRRLKCKACGGRIWESGVGLRQHRRTCKGGSAQEA